MNLPYISFLTIKLQYPGLIIIIIMRIQALIYQAPLYFRPFQIFQFLTPTTTTTLMSRQGHYSLAWIRLIV